MSQQPTRVIQLPDVLQRQLHQYRHQVWHLKTTEAWCQAVVAIVAAFLAVFVSDRIWDTPTGMRWVIATLALVATSIVPWAIYRWVWRRRSLDQVAKLIAHRAPNVGDRLLGVLELVDNPKEQARSPELCRAAVEQVADDARRWDLRDSLPASRYRLWTRQALACGLVGGLLALLVPAATQNALARFFFPWKSIPRYTFAAIEPLPKRMIVPHGESYTLRVNLTDQSQAHPETAEIRIAQMVPVKAQRTENHFEFVLPPQVSDVPLHLVVGDAYQDITLVPTHRPELTAVTAQVTLPKYLGRSTPQIRDVRSGSLTSVLGSNAIITAQANRELESASINGQEIRPAVDSVTSSTTPVQTAGRLEFRWRDKLGLSEKQPFHLNINPAADEPPVVTCEGIPRQRVVLNTEQIPFQVHASDDFGVQQLGMEWQGMSVEGLPSKTSGEQILAAGGVDRESLQASGTFTAQSLGIEPQAIQLRIYVTDYLPDRPRVYSPTYLLYVLDAQQHAIWMTEQLNKWHRQALEVRDRELQLYETNKELRALPEEQLDQPETREQITRQASAEQANGRRLEGLTALGEDLVKQAARNTEFGVGHLEKWAEMLQLLKDISANRMPSVADLLKEASQSPQIAKATPAAPMAGQNRNPTSGKPSDVDPNKKPAPPVPAIVDRESSQQPPSRDEQPTPEGEKSKPSSPSLRLPVTTLAGQAKPGEKSPTADKMDQAVTEQKDLLAEFEKIANELNTVLANLEGSTLVKRLKAAAREQYRVAGELSGLIDKTFGRKEQGLAETERALLTGLTKSEVNSSDQVSFIMDDLQAYFERRPLTAFRTVLDEMKESDIVGGLRQLSGDLPQEQGLSIAQCEFWSDSLDRWAEDLVDPACAGNCPGCKSRGSLPPSIILEVLQVLEAEVNLREETRVTEQAKPALSKDDFAERAEPLGETQETLRQRIDSVEERIRKLPEGEDLFQQEIGLMQAVSGVMRDAAKILRQPETGATAIAAETEAIELLLKSKRINPKGGGGGGSTPGGGGKGTTTDSAIALLGKGVNEKEVREERGVSQSTGDAGPKLPEEFRAGLDEYFNRLAQPNGG